jgi:hypothetical protein
MNDIIKLNVGGQLFVTTRATLCAEFGSMLATKFDDPASTNFAPPKKEPDGAVFLDQSPKTFEHVLSYLRHGCQVVSVIPDELLKELRADADYFGLEALQGACDNQLLETALLLDQSKRMDKREYVEKCTSDISNAAKHGAKWMNKGWRLEKEFLNYDSKGNVDRYNFVISKPI